MNSEQLQTRAKAIGIIADMPKDLQGALIEWAKRHDWCTSARIENGTKLVIVGDGAEWDFYSGEVFICWAGY